jgi:molybdenum cofactor cytidylyltransferase
MKSKVPIVILAAGQSKRLGQAKQLLFYKDDTLLNNAIKIANSVSESVVVVLGYDYSAIMATIKAADSIVILHNHDFVSGMASSIKLAVNYLKAEEAILFMLCDQPYLNASILNGLLLASDQSNALIIASEYTNQIGVPMLIRRQLFNELRNLSGDIGAKAILKHHPNQITTIPFPFGEIDIDTIDDLKYLE